MAEISQLSRRERPTIWVRLRSAAQAHAQEAALFAVFLLAGWFAFSWFQTVSRIVRNYSPIPQFDYWRTAAYLHFYQAFDVTVLWRQHNDHRIIFPEIVFAADLLLLHGREILPISLSFLGFFGNWAVLAWTFCSVDSVSKELRAAGVLLAGIVIGWQGSAIVIASPFLIQWVLTQLAALLSLAFLVRLKETGRRRNLALAILFAVIATYSSSNGLVLWAVLIVAALLLRVDKRQVLILAASGILSVAIYFIGYKFSGELSIKTLILHPIYFVEFIAAYLSMPFGALKSPRFGMKLGLVTVCIVVGMAVVAVRKRRLRSRAGVVLFGSYLFLILTAALTAAGRMDITDLGFVNAKAARYVSGPLAGWGIFILITFWFVSQWRKAAGYVLALVFAVLLLLGLAKLRWWLQIQETDFSRAQLAALAMEQGIYDPSIILGIFPDAMSAELWSKGLRENRLSVFYKSHAKWLGQPADRFAHQLDTVAPGQVSYTIPVRGGLEIAGWFDTSQTNFRHAQWVVFANEAGQMAGFGRKLPAGFPDSIDSPRMPPSLGWVGFINLKYPVKTFTTFLIDRRGLIPLQGSTSIPDEQIVDGRSVGAQVAGIQWQMDPAWSVNGIPANWPFGYPPRGPVFGSWSGDDANTGRLTSSVFAPPADGCLVLPVLQGPRGGNLSASIVNPQNNQAVAQVRFDNGPNAWKFWEMRIPSAVTQVRIIADDRGKGWGEWLAIASPSKCR